MLAIKRLLVPIDFSPASLLAVDYAIDVARRYGAAIEVLHVIEPMFIASVHPDGVLADRPDVRERQGQVQQRLAAAVADLLAIGSVWQTQASTKG